MSPLFAKKMKIGNLLSILIIIIIIIYGILAGLCLGM
jgi:hypothetical protein